MSPGRLRRPSVVDGWLQSRSSAQPIRTRPPTTEPETDDRHRTEQLDNPARAPRHRRRRIRANPPDVVGASRDDAHAGGRLPRPLVESDRASDLRLHLRPVHRLTRSLKLLPSPARGPGLAPFFVSLAEGVGFEPTVRLPVRRFSRPLHSSALPPLRSTIVRSTDERRPSTPSGYRDDSHEPPAGRSIGVSTPGYR